MKSKKTIGMLALVALVVGGSIAAVTQTSMDETLAR